MKIINTILCAAVLSAPAVALAATPAPPQPEQGQPANGVTMQHVSKTLGAPVKKVAAVGTPPIARWVYPNFVVYFEGNRVLHTVSRKRPFKDAPSEGAVKHIISGHQVKASGNS